MTKSTAIRTRLAPLWALLAACTLAPSLEVAAQKTEAKTTIVNGAVHTDIAGNLINAHGGGFLKVGEYYYWIGENRHDDVLVSCYRSKDLVNWELRGDLLTRQSNPELAKANIERPKVIYNEATKQFVMWMHYEIRTDYSYARAAVATSSDIEKPFTYLRSFRPFDNMSRDCNLFKDDDGTAYFISSTRENRDMNVYELTADYLDVKEKVLTLWPGSQREAPAVVKRGRYYFMLTSFCTGWDPNQAKYAFATSMRGPWSALKNVGSPMSFDTQPTYILPIQGAKTTSYLYVGDRWDPSQYFNSRYIFLPLTFANDTTMVMEWASKLSVDMKSGKLSAKATTPKQLRIKSKWTGAYLAPLRTAENGANAIGNYRLDYAKEDQRWVVEPTGKDFARIRHVPSGRYLDDQAALSDKNKDDGQVWKIVKQSDGWCKLVNKKSGKALSIERSRNKSDEKLFTTAFDEKYDQHYDKQGFLLAPAYE
ncbi:family 43 glycosylhydrolase [uncultured Acetobacteroides sp.]|uniref:family 43 glycosylhydrolase n=1 Tax=uncultured Acetobacteroides sp. TaxID=1760811 RepID=UPI0029F59225|nr:family 43 glycosylhydrolase [uncultured Acetobacteroides sp.]